MSIDLTRYFRVLVVGEENKFAGDIIEKEDPGIETLLEDFNRVGAAINRAYFEEE